MKSLIAVTLMMLLMVTSCSSRKKDDKKKEKRAQPSVSYVGPGESSATTPKTVAKEKVSQATANWAPPSQELLNQMISKYGQPQEVNEQNVVWYNNGQWTRTVLSNEPGQNMLKQTVRMAVPAETLGELSIYNENITVDQANEEVTTSSNKEELNYLSLNLAREVIDGKTSPYEAKRKFTSLSSSLNRSKYLEELNFGVPSNDMKQSQEE